MEKGVVERTKTFKWNSRVELYKYFQDKYDLGREKIDPIILNTIDEFHLRKHQVIKTQELWQKVGNNLECEYLTK